MRLNRLFPSQFGPNFVPVIRPEVLPGHGAQRGDLNADTELAAWLAYAGTNLPQVCGTESKVPREHFSATLLLSEVCLKVHAPMLGALAPSVKSHIGRAADRQQRQPNRQAGRGNSIRPAGQSFGACPRSHPRAPHLRLLTRHTQPATRGLFFVRPALTDRPVINSLPPCAVATMQVLTFCYY